MASRYFQILTGITTVNNWHRTHQLKTQSLLSDWYTVFSKSMSKLGINLLMETIGAIFHTWHSYLSSPLGQCANIGWFPVVMSNTQYWKIPQIWNNGFTMIKRTEIAYWIPKYILLRGTRQLVKLNPYHLICKYLQPVKPKQASKNQRKDRSLTFFTASNITTLISLSHSLTLSYLAGQDWTNSSSPKSYTSRPQNRSSETLRFTTTKKAIVPQRHRE